MPFTIGLGRNSPIPLEGDPKKYEGLIVRHGQWVRWASARKCSCILANNRPDPRCTKCKGMGWRYSFQSDEEDMAVEAQIVDFNTIELPYEIDTSRVLLIQDGAGTKYTIETAYGRWIKIVGTFPQSRGLIYVSMLKSRVLTITGATGIYLGHALIQVEAPEYQNPWARVPVDILSVISVSNSAGVFFNVTDFAVDKIMLDENQIYFQAIIEGGAPTGAQASTLDGGTPTAPQTTTIEGGWPMMEPAIGEHLTVTFTYMPPYRIAILNQAISEMDQRALQEVGGDALALFPYAYKVAEQDTITSWASTQVRKKVLKKSTGDTDILPDLFVTRVLRLEDINREYSENVDFIVWDRNTIRWINGAGNMPAAGANYSIEYMANATYRVMMQFPNIRSSEDKRFPMRVGVKLESGITGGDQI